MSETAIRALDAQTVERIAAGEVVERPASVVKELVENALDADASRVDVAVESGGVDGVVVRDDGHGMTSADVRASVREHTTSKIEDVADLDAGVSTLGFRGEALHTIGAVSRLTIRSRPQSAETGTELVYDGGAVESLERVGCPAGTTVEVTELFYNTPARRKYLKTTPTEFAHVNRVVRSYALANPDVAVSLTHDDREVFATPGRGDRRATVLAVYGREVAEAMVAVDDVEVPEGPLEDVRGLVSDPETNRSAREYVSVFVNGRAVAASAIREAILAAYGGQLDADRYPFTVLYLDVDPGDVDPNIHPRKQEVRFPDEAAVKRQVTAVVESALLEEGLVRSGAPRGRSKAPETAVDPDSTTDLADRESIDDDTPPEVQSADDGASRPVPDASAPVDDASTRQSTDGVPGRDSSASDAPTSGATASDSTTNSERQRAHRATGESVTGESEGETAGGDACVGESAETGTASESDASAGQSDASAGQSDSTAGQSDSTAGQSDASDGQSDASDIQSDASDIQSDASDGQSDASDGQSDASDGQSGRRRAGGWFGGGTSQRTLTGETATAGADYDRLPSMRILGQYRDTYLVAETDDGLVLVDQHAADERVHYEQLRAAFAEDVTAQALATPVTLELTAGEAAAFPAYRDALATLGFHAEGTDRSATRREDADGDPESDAETMSGAQTVTVTTVPAVFDETLDPADVRDVLAGFIASDDDGASTVEALADAFVADLACYPSVTANTSLTEGSVVDLLEALDDCENPFACPHGRPTIVELDHDDLEARFERDYPGHGGRRRE